MTGCMALRIYNILLQQINKFDGVLHIPLLYLFTLYAKIVLSVAKPSSESGVLYVEFGTDDSYK